MIVIPPNYSRIFRNHNFLNLNFQVICFRAKPKNILKKFKLMNGIVLIIQFTLRFQKEKVTHPFQGK